MKIYSIFLLVAAIFTSCKSVQVAVPGSLSSNGDKYHVKGTGVSVFGHKMQVEGLGEGRMYSGFVVRTGTGKRLFPLYFDLDKRLNYISNHLKIDVSKSKAKYHFDFASNGIYTNTYCVARSVENSLNVNRGSLQIDMDEAYHFEGLIFTNQEQTPWQLRFDGSRNYKKGLSDYTRNVRQADGILTNDSTVIHVNLVNIRTTKRDGTTRSIPFNIPAGYEFKEGDTLLAFVDMFDRNIWISREVSDHMKVVLASAAASILAQSSTT